MHRSFCNGRFRLRPPCVLPRTNYKIGIGRTFTFLKKVLIGYELTFGYANEGAGTHAFMHTSRGEYSEQWRVIKKLSLQNALFYWDAWIQVGITSHARYRRILNRLDKRPSIGTIGHLSYHRSIWIQERYGKVVTVRFIHPSDVPATQPMSLPLRPAAAMRHSPEPPGNLSPPSHSAARE
jgi:hypothetical protein